MNEVLKSAREKSMRKRDTRVNTFNGNLVGLFIVSNTPLILFVVYNSLYNRTYNHLQNVWLTLTMLSLSILFLCISMLIHIQPMLYIQMKNVRIKILMGGKNLIKASYGAFVLNSLMFFLLDKVDHPIFTQIEGPFQFLSLLFNYLFGVVVILLFYTNGWIRIIATSRRIDPIIRVLIGLTAYLPIFHLVSSIYLVKKANTEYQHEWDAYNLNTTRVESKICGTRYPLLMLHGVGFRDLKYINYWGRIPGQLIKNGAKVYYGHQEAWGTIESNAAEIKEKILDILTIEQTDKVNIIAHSKGGLDARYVVSQLGMGDYVASVTTISSPHHGSEVLEFVEKLPAKLVDTIGNGINKYFKLLGDKTPNFHIVRKQFLIENSKIFNETVKDHPKVYYQSYGTTMKSAFSDPLLFLPYCIVRLMGNQNDGLVTINSACWGDFKGIISNTHWRGISHGDIIDLKREDYHGFDVREFYVQLVSELKNKGF